MAAASRMAAAASRQAKIERAAGISTKTATPTKTTTTTPSTKTGFAPGSRPGVITTSGKHVYKGGRLVGSYKSEAEAKQAAAEYTAPGFGGRQVNIAGDKSGETFRQLYRTDKGPQTGKANQLEIARAIGSRGMVPVYDEKGNIVGSRSQEQVRQLFSGAEAPRIVSEASLKEKEDERRTRRIGAPQGRFFVPTGELYQKKAPVLREPSREQEVFTRIAKERGIDPKTAPASAMTLLNEAVNTEIYGTPSPTFGEGANVLTQAQKAQEMAVAATRMNLREQLTPTGPVVTSDVAQDLVTDQIARLEEGMAYSTAGFAETVDSLYPLSDTQDPDLIAEAEAEGKKAQDLLNERRQFLMDQYENMTERLKEIYQSKADDYREQAKVAMGQSIATLARMGALGTSSAGVQYLDDQDRNDRAKLLSFAAEEAAAQQTAYEAFQNADFDLAEKMITTARQTRLEIQDIKDKILNRQIQIENLKSMRAETASKTVDNLAKAGYSAEDLPQGYLASLDRQMGYPAGISARLLDVVKKEQQELDIDAQIKQAVDMANLIKNMEVGGPPVTVGDLSYSLLNYGNEVTGTESGGTGTYLWTVNETTGQTSVRKIGPPTNQKYTDVTSNEGAIVRVYEDGTNKLIFDPRQPNGGYATGGLVDAFPQDSVTPFTRPNDPNKDRASECGAWVNDVTGMRFGDTFSEKLSLMDASIIAENAEIGDVFLTRAGSTGHVGIINGKSIVNGELFFTVSESNWVKDPNNPTVGLITHDRQVKASEIVGFARPGFKDLAYNFGTDANAGRFAGLTFGKVPTVVDSRAVSAYARGLTSGTIPISSIPEEYRTAAVIESEMVQPATIAVENKPIFDAFNVIGPRLGAKDIRESSRRVLTEYLNAGDIDGAKNYLKDLAFTGAKAEEQQRWQGRNNSINELGIIRALIQEYTDAGGDTGIFKGTQQQIEQKIGKIGEPELADIATRIQLAIIDYRQSVSGAAFTESEAAQYNKLFPNILKGTELNLANIDTLEDVFTERQEQFYRTQLGTVNYDNLFGAPISAGKAPSGEMIYDNPGDPSVRAEIQEAINAGWSAVQNADGTVSIFPPQTTTDRGITSTPGLRG
jgi:hypothetical protein